MRKIKQYKAVSDTYVCNLTTKVETEMKNGWQPFGSIAGKQSEFAQALVKYEEEPIKKKPCHNYSE